jgi:predicted small lipoprotein YifL
MRPTLALIALLGAAACGADGPPERPSHEGAAATAAAGAGATNGILSTDVSP